MRQEALQIDLVTREEWHWALQGRLPAPSGWAAIPNVGALVHLPKGEGKGEEGRGQNGHPREAGGFTWECESYRESISLRYNK